MTPTLLVADDESVNLALIVSLLKDEGYRIVTAENGLIAWELLEAEPEKYDAILLDRKMPGMSGLEVLTRTKAHPVLKMVPVIFQTSMNKEEDIMEGFRAGVDYYLTKPLKKEILLAIVKAALSGHFIYKSLWKDLCYTPNAVTLTRTAHFEFRTVKEAQMLTTLLASVCPKPDKVALGLWELMLNAVEHGNLGITYQEKSDLLEKDKWEAELKRRMDQEENKAKKVTVQFESSDREIRFMIQDQGAGFDWRQFTEPKPERAFDPNGRGIHLARTVSFDRVEYVDPGNKVLAYVKCDPLLK